MFLQRTMRKSFLHDGMQGRGVRMQISTTGRDKEKRIDRVHP